MKPKHLAEKGQSLRIFWLFSTAVIVLITISLIFKLVALIAASSFDGEHRFTLVLLEQPVRVLSFAPDAQMLSVLTVTDIKTPTKNEVEKLITLPIDATVEGNKNTTIWSSENDQKTNVNALLQAILFQYSQGSSINMFDSIRLWMFVQSLPTESVLSQSIPAQANAVEKEKIIMQLFSDRSLSQENKSVQIVNGTGISGFGTNFAARLTNIGGNVVSVTTAQKPVSKTTIMYYGDSSYTLEKIEKIIEKKAEESKKQHISDIIITLGKDAVEK